MKIDLNRYIVNKNFVQKFYKTHKVSYDLGSAISVCATSTGCPCVVVAFYLGEDIGFTPELIVIIDRLIKFYRYTEFIGAPESYYEAIK
jgi:hypothetical protein